MTLHQLFKERNAVHSRHLYVQCNDIRLQVLDFLSGNEWVLGGCDDLNAWIGIQDVT